MSNPRKTLLAITVAIVAGCATTQDYLNTNEAAAQQTAVSRGQFELNCQNVTASILSRKIIDPVIGGQWRAEYTIGVRGCGRQVVYLTICIDNENCNAISNSGQVEEMMNSN